MSLHLENLTVVFKDPSGKPVPILNVPELHVADGAKICLVGGSGSGKTTLLNVIAGIVAATSGRVLFDAVDLTTLPEAARDRFRAQNVGYVFQTFNLLQGLTALENVMLAQAFAGKKGATARQRAEDLLDRVGLAERRHSRPGTLSVGEQQRVAIARAIVNAPRVVLADEPTANLDETNGDQVLTLLKEVTSEENSMLLLVTHETRVMQQFEDVRPLKEISR